jgi:FkbM family methyltransferase
VIDRRHLRAVRRAAWGLQARAYRRTSRRLRERLGETEARVALEEHGDGTAAYRILAAGLGPDSVVYSCGVGCDISFDVSLIERHGVRVHAFDPTEEAERYVREQRPPERFSLHRCAVADRDGEAWFSEIVPLDNPHYKAGALGALGPTRRREAVRARSIASLMAELGHDRLDVLKLDIEGGEFAVLEHVLERRPRVDQIVVEFHPHLVNLGRHRTLLGRHGWRETARAIAALRAAGYVLVHRSPRGTEFTFVSRERLGDPSVRAEGSLPAAPS